MRVVFLSILVSFEISAASPQLSIRDDRRYTRLGSPVDTFVAKSIEKKCYFEGRWYESGDRIPRSHVCHICSCVRGYVDCMWIDCPPAPEGCTEMNFPGVCNPALYLCPIPPHNSTTKAIDSSSRPWRSDVPPEELEPVEEEADCMILGVPYRRGDTIGVASHFCLECRCASGEMYCSPKCCFRPAKPNEDSSQLMKAFRQAWRPIERHPLHHLREDFEQANG